MRTRNGPPPDPNALRRNRPNDQAGWTRLPSIGLTGDIPEWPLEIEPASIEEQALWNRMWREYPQAHEWKRSRNEMALALHVRTVRAAAMPGARAALLNVARLQADALLLSTAALRSARLTIEADESTQTAPVLTLAPSVRDRMAAAPEPDEDEDQVDEDEDDYPRDEDDE